MELKIDLHQVADGVYAHSALQAVATEHPGSYMAAMLTPDHEDALLRIAADALTVAAVYAGRRVRVAGVADGEATLVVDAVSADCLPQVRQSMTAATTLLLVHLLARICGVEAADVQSEARAAAESVATLLEPVYSPVTMMRHEAC